MPITDEDIARLPLSGMAIPGTFRFSPDDSHLTFLWSAEGTLENDLWAIALPGGKPFRVLSAQEGFTTGSDFAAEDLEERERRRDQRMGVVNYVFDRQGARVLVPLRDRLVAHDLHTRKSEVLLQGTSLSHFRISPDGSHVAFAKDRQLCVAKLGDLHAAPRVLTRSHRPHVHNGVLDFIAAEELGRTDAFFWHPNSDALLFVETDEQDVTETMLPDPITGYGKPHRYPFTGTPNVRYRLGVVQLESGDTRFLDLGPYHHEYLTSAQFDGQGRIVVEVMPRGQQELFTLRFESALSAPTLLVHSPRKPWINLHGDPIFLQDGTFLRMFDVDGLPRLEHRADSGELLGMVPSPEGGVRRFLGLDETAGQVYFLGAGADPTEQHFYRAPLRGHEMPKQLSSGSGVHDATRNGGTGQRVRVHHSLEQAPRLWLEDENGETLLELPCDGREIRSDLVTPERITLSAADGTALHGLFYRPAGKAPFPLAVAVYGGPHHQAVRNAFELKADLRTQRLVQDGIAVFKLDNRGAGGRGPEFEAGLYRAFGQQEVSDQVRGVEHLIAQGLVDRSRVAIYGWSYGGYMAARCLFKASHLFKAAVIGAAVVEWELYDTGYTERYMGPLSNDEDRRVYHDASLLSDIPDKPGAMYILHGLSDENVLFQHAARLLTVLNERNIPYELMVIPGERHGVRKPGNRLSVERSIHAFLKRQLLGAEPS